MIMLTENLKNDDADSSLDSVEDHTAEKEGVCGVHLHSCSIRICEGCLGVDIVLRCGNRLLRCHPSQGAMQVPVAFARRAPCSMFLISVGEMATKVPLPARSAGSFPTTSTLCSSWPSSPCGCSSQTTFVSPACHPMQMSPWDGSPSYACASSFLR